MSRLARQLGMLYIFLANLSLVFFLASGHPPWIWLLACFYPLTILFTITLLWTRRRLRD